MLINNGEVMSVKEPNGFELAIAAAGMSKKDALSKLGYSFYGALQKRLQDPMEFRLCEIVNLADGMPQKAKAILKSQLDEIFFENGLR